MGADIHCYIEHSAHRPAEGEKRYWSNFGGRINPGRDYGLFGLLANVRCDGAVYPLRGLPDDVAFYQTGEDAFLRITEDTDLLGGEGRYCSLEKAEGWIKGGYSRWVDEGKKITDPDWHSHTWMTLVEWETVLAHQPRVHAPYKAISAAMKAFSVAGEDVRVVFWFDN